MTYAQSPAAPQAPAPAPTRTASRKGAVLAALPWVQALMDEDGMEELLTCGAMSDLKPLVDSEGIDPDHLFAAMLREGLLRDVLFLLNRRTSQLHLLLALGSNIAGHPRITHGGLTSAVLDEATGGLVYELKKMGQLGAGPAFTARLEVDYKQPLPVNTVVICTASIESTERRKIWARADMLDQPGGKVYAEGRALYVTAKQPEPEAAGEGGPPQA